MTPQIWPMYVVKPADWLALNDRRNRYAQARLVREWRRAARLYAMSAKLPRGLERVRIEAWFRFNDRRRRDVHNWMPTAKAIVDGLVDYGLIPDDNDSHLIGPDLRTGEPHRVGLVALIIEER